MINILIRNKFRPELFERCIQSIRNQTYQEINLIISCDSPESKNDALLKTKDLNAILVDVPPSNHPYDWNLYSNSLKAFVDKGWFFYLDNDDFLYSPQSLETISKHLTNPEQGVICQMLRKGRPKPAINFLQEEKIVKGKIGAPCLFLHHSKKYIADWDSDKAADYRWIKDVSCRMALKFVPVVVVETGNNGLRGK